MLKVWPPAGGAVERRVDPSCSAVNQQVSILMDSSHSIHGTSGTSKLEEASHWEAGLERCVLSSAPSPP